VADWSVVHDGGSQVKYSNYLRRFFYPFLPVYFVNLAHAAIPKNAMKPPASILLVSKAGEIHSVQGGMAGKFTSLLDLRTTSASNGSFGENCRRLSVMK